MTVQIKLDDERLRRPGTVYGHAAICGRCGMAQMSELFPYTDEVREREATGKFSLIPEFEAKHWPHGARSFTYIGYPPDQR